MNVENKNPRNYLFSAISTSGNITNRPKSSAVTKRMQSAKSYLKENLKKQHLEKELIRLEIEKRNKEFERECLGKMHEANELCFKLNLQKSYSAYNDEVYE